MPGSSSYKFCVLIFDVVDLHTLVTKLILTYICFCPEKYKWIIHCSDFLVYISACSLAFSQEWKYLEDVQRSLEILKGLQM